MVINSEGILKICDFGSSRTVTTGIFSTNIQGTYNYMPPEVIIDMLLPDEREEEGSLDSEAYNQRLKELKEEYFSGDMWAMGVILFEMITLKCPFNDKRGTLNLNNIKSVNYQKDLIKNPEILAILASIFKKNPKQRIKIGQLIKNVK